MKGYSLSMLAICIGAYITTSPLLGHHGSAGYDRQNAVTVTGTIRSIEWVNPHSFIYLDVVAEDGTKVTWALEGPPVRVAEVSYGWSKEKLKPGMSITVAGYLLREGPIPGVGTLRNLADALAYSPAALNLLKTRHLMEAGEIRLSDGQIGRWGMGPALTADKK